MTLPNLGHIITATYSNVMAIFSMHSSCTFLPLWSKASQSHMLISIGFINNDHFVQVTKVLHYTNVE